MDGYVGNWDLSVDNGMGFILFPVSESFTLRLTTEDFPMHTNVARYKTDLHEGPAPGEAGKKGTLASPSAEGAHPLARTKAGATTKELRSLLMAIKL